jgi:hypothetical protein
MKTTKDNLEEEEAFLSDTGSDEGASKNSPDKRTSRWRSICVPRLLLEVAMAATILVMIVYWPSTREAIKKTPVPKCMYITWQYFLEISYR